jgi:hypothetical protein
LLFIGFLKEEKKKKSVGLAWVQFQLELDQLGSGHVFHNKTLEIHVPISSDSVLTGSKHFGIHSIVDHVQGRREGGAGRGHGPPQISLKKKILR